MAVERRECNLVKVNNANLADAPVLVESAPKETQGHTKLELTIAPALLLPNYRHLPHL
jgi:hypothetical protein